MSNISSTDNNYQYYKNRLDDIEDEYKRDTKKRKEANNDEIERLKETHERELKRRAEQSERAIQDAKDKGNDTLADERQAQKDELANLKKQTYDRFGRYRDTEKEDLKRTIDDVNHELQAMQDRDRIAYDKAQNDFHHRVEQLNTEQASALSHAVEESQRKQSDSTERGARENHDYLYNEQHGIQARYQQMARRQAEDAGLERTANRQALDEMHGQYASQSKSYQESEDRRGDERAQSYSDKMERNARDMRDAYENQLTDLRKQANEASAMRNQYYNGFARGKADAIKQYENEWRTQQDAASAAYSTTVDSLHHQLEQNDKNLARINDSNMKEKDRYFSGLIEKQNLDNYGAQKDMRDGFERNRTQLEQRNQDDRRRADEASERQAQVAGEHLTEALDNQARSYRSAMQRQSEGNKAEMEAFQANIRSAGGGRNDGGYVPAATEDRIRKDVQAEYDKSFNTERQRDDARADSLQKEYAKRLSDVAITSQTRETLANQQRTNEKVQSDLELARAVQDAQWEKQEALRRQDSSNERGRTASEHAYANALEKQRQEFTEAMTAMQQDSEAKMMATRRDADFSYKMQQRSFAQRENEIVRDYEKRLADQKEDYEALVSETKSVSDQKVRESDRRNRLALEEQSKGYEQRIAQLEAQQKERERLVAQNYQEDLDKIRRSNAQLLHKKG